MKELCTLDLEFFLFPLIISVVHGHFELTFWVQFITRILFGAGKKISRELCPLDTEIFRHFTVFAHYLHHTWTFWIDILDIDIWEYTHHVLINFWQSCNLWGGGGRGGGTSSFFKLSGCLCVTALSFRNSVVIFYYKQIIWEF